MRYDSVCRVVEAHGPFRGRVVCEYGPPLTNPVRDGFCRADGPRLVEALLGAAGLLDAPGGWTVRPLAALPPPSPGDTEPRVVVREASATAVRLTLRPGRDGVGTGLDCQLLVFRDKGDPGEVRKKLKDAVAALRATEPPLVPVAAVADRPAHKKLAPPRPGSPDDEIGGEAGAICSDRAYLRSVIEAVDAVRTAKTLNQFVRAICLEFGPDQNRHVWSKRLAALARAGILTARRAGVTLIGYEVSTVGRRRLDDLAGSSPPSSAQAVGEILTAVEQIESNTTS